MRRRPRCSSLKASAEAPPSLAASSWRSRWQPGFSIQPEALYQKRKSTIDFAALEDILGETIDASIEADYIEVPVFAEVADRERWW